MKKRYFTERYIERYKKLIKENNPYKIKDVDNDIYSPEIQVKTNKNGDKSIKYTSCFGKYTSLLYDDYYIDHVKMSLENIENIKELTITSKNRMPNGGTSYLDLKVAIGDIDKIKPINDEKIFKIMQSKGFNKISRLSLNNSDIRSISTITYLLSREHIKQLDLRNNSANSLMIAYREKGNFKSVIRLYKEMIKTLENRRTPIKIKLLGDIERIYDQVENKLTTEKFFEEIYPELSELRNEIENFTLKMQNNLFDILNNHSKKEYTNAHKNKSYVSFKFNG